MASLKSRILTRILSLPLVMGLLTLWPAGTFDYWQVYVYVLLILALSTAATGYFLRHDPSLLERRLRTREQQGTQKAVVPLLLLLVIAGFVVPGLDRRYGWSEIPVGVVIVAFVLMTLSYLFVFRVMTLNSFASRVIEVAENQEVIRTGPYAVIRHPMYAGVTVMYLMTPVALGSWWGLIPFALLPLLLVPRILGEEKLLLEELAGYRDYCRQVRWRLLPYVW